MFEAFTRKAGSLAIVKKIYSEIVPITENRTKSDVKICRENKKANAMIFFEASVSLTQEATLV